MINKIEIIKGDITTVECDAIVNAANECLLCGGGVCGSIFRAAGKKELQKECNEIGGCDTGSAVITKGYNLKCKYIIHAVGPVYESDEVSAPILRMTYESILKLAEEYQLESIAIPTISTGIYGYPKDKAAQIVIETIKDHNISYLNKIMIICFEQIDYDIYLSKIKSNT